MKILTYLLTAACLLTSYALAEDKGAIKATLISTTISSPLPEGTGFGDRPHSYTDGASLTFYFKVDNLISFDTESFFVAGWDKNFRSQVTSSGKSGAITIYNSKFKGIIEELEAEGRVDVLVGTESKTKELTLKKDADPVKFPMFTVELKIEEGNKNGFGGGTGVKVDGKHQMISSMVILRDGKEITSNGYNSSNDTKTFRFREIKDGDKIKIVYWDKLKTRSVVLFK